MSCRCSRPYYPLSPPPQAAGPPSVLDLVMALRRVGESAIDAAEREIIVKALERNRWLIRRTAEYIGMTTKRLSDALADGWVVPFSDIPADVPWRVPRRSPWLKAARSGKPGEVAKLKAKSGPGVPAMLTERSAPVVEPAVVVPQRQAPGPVPFKRRAP